MTDAEFAREIRTDKLSGVYFLYGDEDYLKNYRAGEAKKQLSDNYPEAAAFNLFELSFGEGECDIEKISSALSSPSMMSPKKITSVSFSSLDSVKDKDKTALLELLEEHSSEEGSIVIIRASSGGFDYGSEKKPCAFLKNISKFAKAVRFDYQSPSKLYQWLSKHASGYGLTLLPESAELLINTAGKSMYTLSGEITKISAYAASHGKREITPEDVSCCSSTTDEDDAFALANALTDGNTEAAYKYLGIKMRLRTDPYYLLGQITKTFTDLAAAAAYIKDGRDKSEFARDMKMHEYKAGLCFKAAKNAPYEYFISAVELCLTADRNMKTMSSRGYGEIERLIGLANYRR